jgi:F-type H+-transporting ATPase subunit delta
VRDSIVARSYAGALFELAERHDAHDDFAQGLNTVTALVASDARIRNFFETPKIAVGEKKRVLRDALQDQVSPMFMQFVLVVLQKRRQRLLRSIAAAYRELLDEKLGRLHAQVTLAREPDEALEHAIIAELTRLTGRTVVPHVTVDPEILGGIVVRFGDHIMDGSVRRRLNRLRQRLVQATLQPAG